MDFSFEISEVDDDCTVLCKVSEGSITLEALAEVIFEHRRCVLRGVHVQGSGANTIGTARLLRLVRLVKERLDVEELRIEGAARTSGAGPGRRPRPLIFR